MIDILQKIALFLLDTPEITGPLVVFALTKIPGPFRAIVQAIVNVLIEKGADALEDRVRKTAADAVAAAEQLGGSGAQKKEAAVQQVMKAGADVVEAGVRVEAEVKRMNDYRAQAEADFARIAQGRLNAQLGQ